MTRDTVVQTGLLTSALGTKPSAHAWVARVMAGPDAGKHAAVGTAPLVVGAHKSCDMVLSDARVSSRHLELCVAAEGVHVRDLGSTNGTVWQGARVREAVVPNGAVLELGQTRIKLEAQNRMRLPPSERRAFGGLVGKSVAMREVFAVLELASPTDATILIEGESGTGKEVAARAIHDHSKRAGGPFVVVDGGALVPELAESQLFGHKKGAFTGAVADRPGAFVEATGGTLFLDEVGELPLNVQPKLLRALEQRVVTPLGSDRAVNVDVRIVAATHRDLEAMVAAGSFRFDLFHRLAVVHLAIPPLRDRLDDLGELVEHFYRARGERASGIGGENLERLRRHHWPGNVRELRNVLERAWALSASSSSDFAALNLWLGPRAEVAEDEALDAHLPFKEAKERWIEGFERRYLTAVYARFGGNITRAAEHAGINRRHFRELLKKYGLHG